MLLIPDARRRVTLPPTFKVGQPLELTDKGDGTFLLFPVVTVQKQTLVNVVLEQFRQQYVPAQHKGVSPQHRPMEILVHWEQFPKGALQDAAEILEAEWANWTPIKEGDRL